MKSRYLLGAGAALAVAFGYVEANAQFAFLGGPYPVTVYVGPEGGWTSLNDQTDTVTNPAFTICSGTPAQCPPAAQSGPFTGAKTTAKYNSGYNVGARLGIQYGPLRVEEEYSYRHNGLSNFAGVPAGSTNDLFTGNRNTHAIMTNFIYDFTIGWPVSPHLGFGVGAVDIVDSVSLSPVTLGNLTGTTAAGAFF